MNPKFNHPGRRGVLLGLLASTILAANGLCARASGATSPKHALGFAGPNLLQLTLVDGVLVKGIPVPVPNDAQVRWTRKPTARLGGLGRLNGAVGNFSGNAHRTAPQLFRPFATLEDGSGIPAFLAEQGSAPADLPTAWNVTIDGVTTPVRTVYRKTIPTTSARTGRKTRVTTKRHLVTLALPILVPLGAEVAVTLQGHALQFTAQRTAATPSEAIHICHQGYAIGTPKKAYVGLWLGHSASGGNGTTDQVLNPNTGWLLRDQATGRAVLTGTLTLAKPADEPHQGESNFNGCSVFEVDFSACETQGRFALEIEGVGASPAFTISADPYAEPLRLAARWYYHQRSGIAIEAPFGEGRTRPRNGHPADGLLIEQTNVRIGRTSEGFRREPYTPGLLGKLPPGPLAPNAWGGWHDAGDWDRRPQHMEAVYTMALAVELFPVARQLALNIPESGRSFTDPAIAARRDAQDRGDGTTVLPDLIHEALWGISLWRRTQRSDGGIIGGVEYSLDGIEGSVSWNPVQRCFAFGPEDWAAYHFVNAAAKLGMVIKTVCGDAVLGDQLRDEALAAWTWAEAQLAAQRDAQSLSPEDETALSRTRFKAAASLFRASGNAQARAVFEALNPFAPQDPEAAEAVRQDDSAWHGLDYLRAYEAGHESTPEIAQACKQWARRRIKVDQRMGRDYGLHNTGFYPWGTGWLRFGPGSNWRAQRLALVYALNGGDTGPIGDAVVEGMWFALGCNPSNVSLIQGLGHRAIADPLTKDLDGFGPVPGQPSFGVAGGPLRSFERRRLKGAMYPADQADWPIYTQIFESSAAIISTEHGMRSNAMEWLFACLLCAQHLSSLR